MCVFTSECRKLKTAIGVCTAVHHAVIIIICKYNVYNLFTLFTLEKNVKTYFLFQAIPDPTKWIPITFIRLRTDGSFTYLHTGKKVMCCMCRLKVTALRVNKQKAGKLIRDSDHQMLSSES